MTDQPVPFLRYDTVVVNKDGTLAEWFVNGWNVVVSRTGGEAFNGILGIINGNATVQADLQAQIDAAIAASIARDQALSDGTDGTTASNSGVFSGGLTSGTTWVSLVSVTVTPGGAGGDYTITVSPDYAFVGYLDDEVPSGGTFSGNWRVIEELTGGGTEYTLDSGTFSVTVTPAYTEEVMGITYPRTVDLVFTGLPSGLIAANNAAQSDIRFEIQRASGTNEIVAPGLSGALSVTWTA